MAQFFTLRTHILLCLLLALVVIPMQAKKYPPNPLSEDSGGYLSIANDLHQTGVFTNGWNKTLALHAGAQGQGMFFGPLYPAMLAGVAQIDPVFEETLSCHMKAETRGKRELCSQDLGLLHFVQIALGVLSVVFLWLTAWAVSGRFSVAWLATGLAVVTKSYAMYTGDIMTESLVFPLFHAACFFAALGWRNKSWGAWLGAGVFLGLTALTRPGFVYVIYAALPLFAVAILCARQGARRFVLLCTFMFCAGYSLVTAPWIIRNGTQIGTYAISSGYAPFILQQRLAFNEMSWEEWRASFIYGLPDFGDSLAAKLFDEKAYRRLDYSTPDGFYLKGNAVFKDAKSLAEFASKDRLPELIQHGIKDNLYKHVMVTLSLVWRGMWVGKYWGLVAIPVFFGVLVYALRRRWGEFLVVAFPPWFLLGLHGFTSVNVVRYNLILVPILAVAGAFALLAGVSWLRNKNKAA